jgi:hypothetical protein
MKLKPICFVPVISDVIETPEQINIRLRKAIENKYNNLAFTKKLDTYNKVIIISAQPKYKTKNK